MMGYVSNKSSKVLKPIDVEGLLVTLSKGRNVLYQLLVHPQFLQKFSYSFLQSFRQLIKVRPHVST